MFHKIILDTSSAIITTSVGVVLNLVEQAPPPPPLDSTEICRLCRFEQGGHGQPCVESGH